MSQTSTASALGIVPNRDAAIRIYWYCALVASEAPYLLPFDTYTKANPFEIYKYGKKPSHLLCFTVCAFRHLH
jgi:hypothetical protein